MLSQASRTLCHSRSFGNHRTWHRGCASAATCRIITDAGINSSSILLYTNDMAYCANVPSGVPPLCTNTDEPGTTSPCFCSLLDAKSKSDANFSRSSCDTLESRAQPGRLTKPERTTDPAVVSFILCSENTGMGHSSSDSSLAISSRCKRNVAPRRPISMKRLSNGKSPKSESKFVFMYSTSEPETASRQSGASPTSWLRERAIRFPHSPGRSTSHTGGGAPPLRRPWDHS